MTRYAQGKHALGVCDRCGMEFKLHRLVFETTPEGKPTYRVCRTCFDEVHPQENPPKVEPDAQALWQPRPDQGLEQSRVLYGDQEAWKHA